MYGAFGRNCGACPGRAFMPPQRHPHRGDSRKIASREWAVGPVTSDLAPEPAIGSSGEIQRRAKAARLGSWKHLLALRTPRARHYIAVATAAVRRIGTTYDNPSGHPPGLPRPSEPRRSSRTAGPAARYRPGARGGKDSGTP